MNYAFAFGHKPNSKLSETSARKVPTSQKIWCDEYQKNKKRRKQSHCFAINRTQTDQDLCSGPHDEETECNPPMQTPHID